MKLGEPYEDAGQWWQDVTYAIGTLPRGSQYRRHGLQWRPVPEGDDPLSFNEYRIPLDQPSPLKSWQFREVPCVHPEPKTLADCPSLTNVIVEDENGLWVVACKLGFDGQQLGGRELGPAKNLKFIQYLDPPPQKPQKPLSLNDVPDGRVILSNGCRFWRTDGAWYQLLQSGCVRQSDPEVASLWTVTNHIAEFRGLA